MNKKIKFKTSSISKSYPFKIKKIKLDDIDWEINKEHTTFILKECKLPVIEDIEKSNIISRYMHMNRIAKPTYINN